MEEKKRRKVTIYDIARMVGVAPSTVSRAINGTSYVDSKTYAAIMRAIEETQYQPSVYARNLRRQRTQTICVLVPEISNPFWSDMVQLIQIRAHESEWGVLVGNTQWSRACEASHVDLLLRYRVDGVIFAYPVDPAQVHRLRKAGVKVVVCSNEEVEGVDCVLTDDVEGGRIAARHLIHLGHSRIGFIGGSSRHVKGPSRRLQGFLSVLEEAGIPVNPSWLSGAAVTNHLHGYEEMHKLLGQKERPTAVAAATDLLAVGAWTAAEERGMSVPEDLTIMGYDNIDQAATTRSGLTTIEQFRREQARFSWEILAGRLDGDASRPRRVVITPELVIRQSSGPPTHG